jgi:hypothetical protein
MVWNMDLLIIKRNVLERLYALNILINQKYSGLINPESCHIQVQTLNYWKMESVQSGLNNKSMNLI